jgi:hypothetical protein
VEQQHHHQQQSRTDDVHQFTQMVMASPMVLRKPPAADFGSSFCIVIIYLFIP